MRSETILVTGAARGIGLELARRYAESGRDVIATVRSLDNADALRACASPHLTVAQLDVTGEESIRQIQRTLADRPIDILINNAGVFGGDRQSLENADYAAWLRTFEVNSIAPFRVTTALLPNLRLSDRPRVVALSSQMGSLQRASGGSYAYRSSKAALNKVMQVLAVELRSAGIVVCPVHPGWVRTDMGGESGEISVEECVRGLVALIDDLSLDKSGRFWTWNGREHPW